MDKPLSISGYKKYMQCPKMYEYHYVDKDRPGSMTSALAFGSIMDDVINNILLNKETDPYTELARACIKVMHDPMMFYVDDLDVDLINLDLIKVRAMEKGWKGKDISSALKSFMKDQDSLSEGQLNVLQLAVWTSLHTKGKAMLDGFIKWVLPTIDTVHDVQKHLVSKQGDVHGYLDFTCTLKDGRRVLFDIKTSKSSYDRDAVLKSPQLALYCGIEKYDYAGFIVLNKTMKKNKVKTCKNCSDVRIEGGNTKKCPSCKETLEFTVSPTSYVQVLIDRMPARNINLTAEAMRATIENIRENSFTRNLDTCSWVFGKPCITFDKCW